MGRTVISSVFSLYTDEKVFVDHQFLHNRKQFLCLPKLSWRIRTQFVFLFPKLSKLSNFPIKERDKGLEHGPREQYNRQTIGKEITYHRGQ